MSDVKMKLMHVPTYASALVAMIKAVPDMDQDEVQILFVMGLYAAAEGDQGHVKQFVAQILPQIDEMSDRVKHHNHRVTKGDAGA